MKLRHIRPHQGCITNFLVVRHLAREITTRPSARAITKTGDLSQKLIPAEPTCSRPGGPAIDHGTICVLPTSIEPIRMNSMCNRTFRIALHLIPLVLLVCVSSALRAQPESPAHHE